MAKIKITELVCPSRHLIAGFGFDPDKNTEADAKFHITMLLISNRVNPWCAICGSIDLKFYTRETDYDNPAQLLPEYIEQTKKDLSEKARFDGLRSAAKNN